MEKKTFYLLASEKNLFIHRDEENPDKGSIKIHTPEGDSVFTIAYDLDYYINTLKEYLENNEVPLSMQAIEKVIFRLFF